jgi:hypothetical protein
VKVTAVAYLTVMGKRVTDLTAEELGKAAGEAWNGAAQEALAKGLPVTGSHKGRRYRYYPDGRFEDLGPVAPLPSEDTDKKKRSRRSVA